MRALNLARAAGRADLEQRTQTHRGESAYYYGDYSTGQALLTEALALARRRGDRRNEG